MTVRTRVRARVRIRVGVRAEVFFRARQVMGGYREDTFLDKGIE